jgi:hypothetical protein
MTNELQTYIASLKPGDVFWVDASRYRTGSGYQDTVRKVTPTGQISGSKNRYMPNGKLMGGGYGRIVHPSDVARLRARMTMSQAQRWEPEPVEVTLANAPSVRAAQMAYDAAIREIKG